MKLARFSRPFLLAVLAAAPAPAEPTTRPATPPGPGSERTQATMRLDGNDRDGERGGDNRDNRGDRGGDDRGGPDGRPGQEGRGGPENRWGRLPVTPAEWETVQAFMKENSPARLDMYNAAVTEFGVDDDRVRLARRAAAARYRMLKRQETENPELYKQGLEQVKREDEVWGLVMSLRKDPTSTEIADKLNEKVRESIRLVLEERRSRLDRLRRNLDAEEARLKDDQAKVDDLVARQVQRYRDGGLPDDTRTRRPDRADRPHDGPPPADKSPDDKPPGDKSDDQPKPDDKPRN